MFLDKSLVMEESSLKVTDNLYFLKFHKGVGGGGKSE
jgi:hypothetical protein